MDTGIRSLAHVTFLGDKGRDVLLKDMPCRCGKEVAPNSGDKFNQLLKLLVQEHERELAEVRRPPEGLTREQHRPLTADQKYLHGLESTSTADDMEEIVVPADIEETSICDVDDLPNIPSADNDEEDWSETLGEKKCISCGGRGCGLCGGSGKTSVSVDKKVLELDCKVRTPWQDQDSQLFSTKTEVSDWCSSVDDAPDKKPSMKRAKTMSSMDENLLKNAMQQSRTMQGPTRGEAIVNSRIFTVASTLVIMANTMYIGLQANVMVKQAFVNIEYHTPDKGGEWNGAFAVFDIVFCVLFAVELLSRVVLLRAKFFTSKEKWWHLFDTVIVVTSTVELMGAAVGDAMASAISVLRTARLVRILRLIRAMSGIESIKSMVRSMQTLVHGLSCVASSIIPAFFVMGMCIYICDIFILEAVRSYLTSNLLWDEGEVEILHRFYKDIGETSFTLLASVTGGINWVESATPLEKISGWYKVLYQAYVIFAMLCILNIIAGLFVNVSMSAGTLENDMEIDAMIKEETRYVQKLVSLLAESDTDHSNTVSWDELTTHLEDERVKAYFNTLKLDMKTLSRIFELLDPDGDGEIDIEIFAKGCIEHRGLAASVDVVLLRNAIDEVGKKVDQVLTDAKNASRAFFKG